MKNEFIPTKNSPGERRKAKFKNINTPTLAHMYFGDPRIEMHCLATGKSAWTPYPGLHDPSKDKLNFEVEYDHIRQRWPGTTHVGKSVDKIGSVAPSMIIRARDLRSDPVDLVEFGCMLPLDQSYHKHVTCESMKGDILLKHYNVLPWHLQSSANFNAFWHRYQIKNFTRTALLKHLNDIDAPPIRERFINWKSGLKFF